MSKYLSPVLVLVILLLAACEGNALTPASLVLLQSIFRGISFSAVNPRAPARATASLRLVTPSLR